VFGMPQAAIKTGAVERVVPLQQMPRAILDVLRQEPVK
jgi:chemotaxis response regulator CheB